jgi:hypothetical protein
LADKEAELNKNFESQYGALDDQKICSEKGYETSNAIKVDCIARMRCKIV